MYENDNENVLLNDEGSDLPAGCDNLDNILGGNYVSSVSSGDSGQFISDNPGSAAGDSAVILSVSMADNYDTGDDIAALSLDLQEDIYTVLCQIEETSKIISSVVFLIFVFLLLEWTEKKFTVIVNRFTNRKK